MQEHLDVCSMDWDNNIIPSPKPIRTFVMVFREQNISTPFDNKVKEATLIFVIPLSPDISLETSIWP